MNIVLPIVFALVGLCCCWCIVMHLRGYCRERSHEYNANSTGQAVMAGVDLSGKYAIITGTSSGLGKLTAQIMLSKGCTIIMANRNPKKSEAACEDILASFDDEKEKEEVDKRMIRMSLDLSSLESVSSFAQEFVSRKLQCDYLINNAGIMALPEYQTTKEELEKQWGVNHLGHFYLARLLLQPVLIPSKTRVITLSSVGHHFSNYEDFDALMDLAISEKTFMGSSKANYTPWSGYGNAKVSNILFARQLNTLYAGDGVVSVSCHPGFIGGTGLGDEAGAGITCKAVGVMLAWICCNPFVIEESKSLEQGVSCTLRCVSMTNDEIEGGDFYHNCQNSSVHNKLKAAGVIRNGDDKLAKKLWQASEAIIENAGLAFDLSPV